MQHTLADDGLTKPWQGQVYMNPPYLRTIRAWIDKLCDAYQTGDIPEAIVLLPDRTDTDGYQRIGGAVVCFIDGRLKFIGAAHGAPFPSMVVYLGRTPATFVGAFSDLGAEWERVDKIRG
jgi:hypothetical protein